MKSTGIVRHIDNLGRITLPIELRKSLDMACGDPLEIYTEGNSVILRKHESSCVFCGNSKKVTLFKDKCICDSCRKELALYAPAPEKAAHRAVFFCFWQAGGCRPADYLHLPVYIFPARR